MTRRRSAGLLAAALLGAAGLGCTRSTQVASTAHAPSVQIRVLGAGETADLDPAMDGIRVDIVPGVQFEQTMVIGQGDQNSKETVLNGHHFAIEGDHVRIGPQTYGPVKRGDRVRIANEGVFVNGALLGELPARVPAPSK